MPTLYDFAYRALLTLGAPAMWLRPSLRAKLAKAHRERDGHVPARSEGVRCVLIHAVSVGEVNATREMIVRLLATNIEQTVSSVERRTSSAEHRSAGADFGPLQIVVSVTTDTGFDRARQTFSVPMFAGRVTVVRYPLDLSKYVRRFLDRLRPDVAVLMELEVWPNFVLECRRRGIPVLLVNGRLTEQSFRSYRRFRFLVRRVFASLTAVCAQEEAYAQRFVKLGVPAARVSVTGTMKFDSAQVGERVEGDEELAHDLDLNPRAIGGEAPLIVCGSTGPGEEELLIDAFIRAVHFHGSPASSPEGKISPLDHREPRLAIIPRKPERFDEVARLMDLAWSVMRRSSFPAQREVLRTSGPSHPLILGDTMGELRKFYSLADIVIVGRTFVDLGEKQHGSDMIEPAALGKPVVVGAYTGNFAEPMRAFLAAGAIRQITAASPQQIIKELVEVLDGWLRDPAAAAEMGRRARDVVLANRGATHRHVAAILRHLGSRAATESTARERHQVAS